MEKITIAYRTGLTFLIIIFAGGGIFNIFMASTSTAVQVLGYPTYFAIILGTAQLLGVIGLLIPRLTRVKEWIFAGFYINLLSAMVSHLVVEGIVPVIGVIILILAILTTTHILFHKIHAVNTG